MMGRPVERGTFRGTNGVTTVCIKAVRLGVQHGMRLTPFAGAYEGYLSNPSLLTRMVEAFARGTCVSEDLMGDWDFWAVMDQPVEALRSRYGIPPVEAGEPRRGEAAA